jgi:hypothetical protein
MFELADHAMFGSIRGRPTAGPLYPRVQHHLETFLADAASADAA